MTQDSDEYDGHLGVLQVLAYGRKLLLKTYKEKKNHSQYIQIYFDMRSRVPNTCSVKNVTIKKLVNIKVVRREPKMKTIPTNKKEKKKSETE